MFESQGKLHYSIVKYHKLIVEVDSEIVRYYRAMMPKYVQSQPQMHRPHISVTRHERIPNLDFWGKYEGELVKFYYDGIIHEDTVYYWLNCFCGRLEEIRVELGLSVHSQYTEPPEGFKKVFHITISNKKSFPHEKMNK
jgi:hypothetical protein